MKFSIELTLFYSSQLLSGNKEAHAAYVSPNLCRQVTIILYLDVELTVTPVYYPPTLISLAAL